MLEKILRFSIDKRWFVMVATLAISVFGVYKGLQLPIDAVPDITNTQVQINTSAPGYSPLEAEQRLTYPIETAMAGIPGLDYTRSLSRYGLSQVTVVFEDGTDIYFARQLISERLQQAKGELPDGVETALGPVATGLGEIFMWTIKTQEDAKKEDGTPFNLTDLRVIQDWIIKPQLRNVKGVTEVNTIGGYEKQYHVTPDPAKLVAYGVTFHDVVNALSLNNDNVGAGYIEKNGEQYLVRSPGQVKSIAEIEKIIVKNYQGNPVYVRDIAQVIIGKEQRTGAGTQDGKETVVGTVFMLLGENSRVVSQRVGDKMKEIQKTMPDGVEIDVVYDRTELVDKAIATVEKNLFEGAVFVIAILFLFLGNIRAALITAMVIPVSMLITMIGMVENKVSGNLLSLGALDFGIIVDGAVIIVENCIARLAHEQKKLGRLLTKKERFEVVFSASKEVRQATMFGELIIMTVYLPILTLTGVEGKMFVPMALTVIFALGGAMVLSMTFVPAAIAIFLTGKVTEKENPIMRVAGNFYKPTLNLAMKNRTWVLAGACALIIVCFGIATQMGSEFVPKLNEGDLAVHAMRIPGTSLAEAVEMQAVVENQIKHFPEVKTVFAKLGTAEVASDPMPPNVADTFVILKPKDEWPDPGKSPQELIDNIRSSLDKLVGNKFEWTQPIEMRFNELISGVRADVAVKVFGDDMDVLLQTSNKIAAVMRKIDGAADVRVEQVTGLPVLNIEIDRHKLARTGLNVSDVQGVIEIAIGGKVAGKIYEGDRRFDLIVRMPDDKRQDIEELARLPIAIPESDDTGRDSGVPGLSNYTTLGSIAELKLTPGPNQISRENGKRRVVVSANVRDRDIGTFVEEAQSALDKGVKIPPGYWTTWGGQFEQMISAANRLKIVVPIALVLILVLLFITFGNVLDSLLVFSGVPLALTGGILAIWMRGIPLSISAGVGFIALSGVAVLNGLVLITFINNLVKEGIPISKAVIQGSHARLRPVLMTALVASLGFVPMALATGTGSEVQRPLATVVIGGILSSTLLTLVVLPVLYEIFHKRKNAKT